MICPRCGSSNVSHIYRNAPVYREGVRQPKKLVRISCNKCGKLFRPADQAPIPVDHQT